LIPAAQTHKMLKLVADGGKLMGELGQMKSIFLFGIDFVF